MGRHFILLLLCVCGCATVIVPPSAVNRRAQVRVADYGYHSSLIMPTADGGVIEYTYGDWTYFAQNQKSTGTMLKAMLGSDQATLGRRVFGPGPDLAKLEEMLGAKSIVKFDVESEHVTQLEFELEKRYTEKLTSLIFSPIHKLYFVKDDEPYGVLNNCNHLTARWLERLGCKIEGWVMLSRFKLKDSAS